MTWRFRKSFSPLPGVRITLSPSGVSTSVGVGPFRATIGPRGPAVAANIPGTGLSFRHSLGGSPHLGLTDPQTPLAPQASYITPEPSATDLNEIKSGGSGALTTPGLSEFKRLLEKARREHGEVVRELSFARSEASSIVGRYSNWKNGWLMRRLFKAKFEQLRVSAEESNAKRTELEEQERLSRLKTQIELPDGVAKAFHRMNDEFAVLAKSERIWDTVGQRSTNRIAERTTATRVVQRKPVGFKLGHCELIESECKVPHLENANGGDIYFYPAFALYFVSSDNFALLEYKDIELEFSFSRFIEEEALPGDAAIFGQTWAKVNKDGSPDKRFKGNYQIPIAQYGKISIASTTGMSEEYMVSNAERAQTFSSAWNVLSGAVATGV
jgi:hypothetical protein